MALRIRFGAAPHILARTHWTGAEPSDVEPEFDYSDLVATICVETDELFSVLVEADGGPATDAPRELIIPVPDAECWFVAEGTVRGVDKDGALIMEPDTPKVVRSDAQRLRQIAAMAKAWYCTPRAAVDLQLSVLDGMAVEPGHLITTLEISDSETRALNTVVTRRVWNVDRQSVEVCTGWFGVDWSFIAPVPAPQMVLTHKDLIRRVNAEIKNTQQALAFGAS